MGAPHTLHTLPTLAARAAYAATAPHFSFPARTPRHPALHCTRTCLPRTLSPFPAARAPAAFSAAARAPPAAHSPRIPPRSTATLPATLRSLPLRRRLHAHTAAAALRRAARAASLCCTAPLRAATTLPFSPATRHRHAPHRTRAPHLAHAPHAVLPHAHARACTLPILSTPPPHHTGGRSARIHTTQPHTHTPHHAPRVYRPGSETHTAYHTLRTRATPFTHCIYYTYVLLRLPHYNHALRTRAAAWVTHRLHALGGPPAGTLFSLRGPRTPPALHRFTCLHACCSFATRTVHHHRTARAHHLDGCRVRTSYPTCHYTHFHCTGTYRDGTLPLQHLCPLVNTAPPPLSHGRYCRARLHATSAHTYYHPTPPAHARAAHHTRTSQLPGHFPCLLHHHTYGLPHARTYRIYATHTHTATFCRTTHHTTAHTTPQAPRLPHGVCDTHAQDTGLYTWDLLDFTTHAPPHLPTTTSQFYL